MKTVLCLALSLLTVASSTAQDRPLEDRPAQERPALVQETPAGTAEMQTRDEVRAVILSLFDAMRASDEDAVRAHFHADATLRSVMSRGDGGIQLVATDIDDFAASVGSAPEGALDERLGRVLVEVDGGLAQAWMDYEFIYQGEQSHCGVNAMQLVRLDSGWQILNVVDTRRTCE